jgi:type I restriction enzyme R subunit
MNTHTEYAFETVLSDTLLAEGYEAIALETFGREQAIFPHVALDFIQHTQPNHWEKLEALHGEKTGERVLHDLCKWMDTYGSLATLRHGFKCYGRTLRVAFFKAAHGLNAALEARSAANRMGLTRQLHFSPKHEKSLDVVLSVNGIPVVTLELKNPLTGQTAEDAIRQYRQDRDPREHLFTFKKRTLVHFAVDTEAVYMTTRLASSATHFLPFNRGINGGAGNPPDPQGRTYRTAYLWEEVLQRDSLLDLLARFLHLQIEEQVTDEGKKSKKKLLSSHVITSFRRFGNLWQRLRLKDSGTIISSSTRPAVGRATPLAGWRIGFRRYTMPGTTGYSTASSW